ncbi:hypothetical protein CPS_4875 [Colwellia psychrerythraea 34H]|uniref:Uncharacterized protein n=1 Tax=Colwellia psychrerythraea (strain 34H / ATCC BAA-681) TaxID=167879 RepID=Q47UK8_COLP3|nr:hypothetical protein CPS_4875 [Colwellia psychrerythraea 34H]
MSLTYKAKATLPALQVMWLLKTMMLNKRCA